MENEPARKEYKIDKQHEYDDVFESACFVAASLGMCSLVILLFIVIGSIQDV
jgi:hypothetical protein